MLFMHGIFCISHAMSGSVISRRRSPDRRDARHHRAAPSRAPSRTARGRRAFRKSLTTSPAAVAGRRAEDFLHAARVSPGARRQRAADPGAGRDRLGPRRTAVGRRDARVHGRHHRIQRARSDRPRRGARGHGRRRPDGQAHGVCRRPGPGALAEGARPRRAGRRAAERLADARHERRSADGHERARHRPIRPLEGRSAEQRERLLLGARQPDAHGRAGRHPAPAEERQCSRCRRRSSAASGA